VQKQCLDAEEAQTNNVGYPAEPKRKEAKIKRDQARTRGRQRAESSVDLDKEVKKAANWTRRTGSKRSAVRHKQQPTEMTLGCYTVW